MFNDDARKQDAMITLDGWPAAKARNLVTRGDLTSTDGRTVVPLEAEDVAVLTLE